MSDAKKNVPRKRSAVARYSAQDKKNYMEKLGNTSILMDQILDPGMKGVASRWPNCYGVSALAQTTTQLDAKYDAKNRSSVAVFPQIADAIMATNGSEYIDTLNSNSSGILPYPYTEQAVSLVTNEDVHIVAPIRYNGHAALPKPSSVGLIYPFSIRPTIPTGASTGIMVINVPGATQGQILVTLNFYDSDLNILSQTIEHINNGTLNMFIAESGLSADAVYCQVLLNAQVPYSGEVYITFRASSSAGVWKFKYINDSQHHDVHTLNGGAGLISTAERYFISAQSVLITNTSSSLSDGGQISSGRLPADYVIGEKNLTSDNWYSSLASLSVNNYQGPSKHGSYVFYLPESEQGYFYRPITHFNNWDLPYMASEFTRDDANGSMQIVVDTIVQFTSTSPNYLYKSSDFFTNVDELRYMVGCIEAAYSNDGHVDGIKNMLKKAGNKLNVLLHNPETYKKASKIIGTLGAIAAAV